jgi:hypothetical protein
MDPFDTVNQQGPCELNYWRHPGHWRSGSGCVATRRLRRSEQLAFIVERRRCCRYRQDLRQCATPGSTCFSSPSCDFQYAHGFAFVSDLGAAKLAEVTWR